MTQALRLLALAIALAGVVDPVFAVRRPAPVPVAVHLPPADDPTYTRAVALVGEIVAALGDDATVNGGEAPMARVLFGNTLPEERTSVPTFAIRLSDMGAGVRFTDVGPTRGFEGQRPLIRATARGIGLRNKTTEFSTAAGEVRKHTWAADDERVDIELPVTPTGDVAVVTATTAGTASAALDVPVIMSGRPRVFVYEARPSWTAAFARQALESDQVFAVGALTKTSRGLVVRTKGAPASLSSFDFESADVVIVGGLEALTSADLDVLQRFATERQGSLILAPDAAVPETVHATLGLPAMKAALLQQPIALPFGAVRVQASEVLSETEAIIRRRSIFVATGLDAWRYRGDAFDVFWRALAADAAMRAIPQVAVRVEPVLARPGDEVTLRVAYRVAPSVGAVTLPPVRASLSQHNAAVVDVRLWPGTAVGEFIGTFRAPAPNRYEALVHVGDRVHRTPFIVENVVRGVTPDHSTAIAALAQSSGGAIVGESDIDTLVSRLRAIARPVRDVRIHPLRSAWWAVAFAGLLAVEWTLRRRRGLR